MRKLKVDLNELETAFDSASPEMRYFLDLETGEIVMITDETSRELEDLYDEVPKDANAEQLTAAIQQRNLPDWQKEELVKADQVETGYGTRYVRVEREDPHADYRDMEDFIETVENERLRDRLLRAISGRGAFRYFKDVLEDQPRERERWFEFKDERVHRRALDWLEDKGIEPISE